MHVLHPSLAFPLFLCFFPVNGTIDHLVPQDRNFDTIMHYFPPHILIFGVLVHVYLFISSPLRLHRLQLNACPM